MHVVVLILFYVHLHSQQMSSRLRLA